MGPTETKICLFFTRIIPKRVKYWVCVSVFAWCTSGKYGNTLVPDLTAMEALKRWGIKCGIEKVHRSHNPESKGE